MMPDATTIADYLEFLRIISDSNVRPLIVAGQAVNIWAELFYKDEPELQTLYPFTSADLDIHGLSAPDEEWLSLHGVIMERQRDPFGKAFSIVTHTFHLNGKGGRTLQIQNLSGVSGLTSDELRKQAVQIEIEGVRLSLLNPIACLRAKLSNLASIDQKHRHDRRHVELLVPCARAFIRRMLEDTRTAGNFRPVLNAVNYLMEVTSAKTAIQVARDHGIDLSQTIRKGDFTRFPDPKIERFVATRLPQWLELVRIDKRPPPEP